MSKRTQTPESPEEPAIQFARNLTLSTYGDNVKLRHLRALVKEAVEHGFSDDAPVDVRSSPSFLTSYTQVTIGGKDQ